MTAIDSHTEKIAKLLNQAERAGTEAEGATFLAKAQELATLYSIDLARARHATVAKQRSTPIQRTITLGVRGTRGLNTLVSLFQGVAYANDLKFNVAHNSTYVIAFGFAEDIDVAEALFASLTVQMANAAAEYKKRGDWREQTVYQPGGYEYYRISTGEKVSDSYGRRWAYVSEDIAERWVDGIYKPIGWLSARLDFQAGFAQRVAQRLAAAKQDAEDEARLRDALADDTTTGTELVLADKRDAVEDFYAATSRARGSYRGYRRAVSSAAVSAGRAAGERARLSRSTEVGGVRGELAS